MIQHKSPISGVAAWRDQYVLTAGYDNQIILWDQRTGDPISRCWHDHLANQCAFSPDGRLVVTSSSDYSARLWTVPDLRLTSVLAAQDDDTEMSAFHPTEQLVATASRDHNVRVYDFGGRLLHTFTGHRADVISVEWMRGGDEIVSSSDDGTVRRWSLATGRQVAELDMGGVETDTVAIAGTGHIFAGTDNGEIVTVRDGGRTVVGAHDAGIKRLVLDDGRHLLVSLSYDRTMRMWDVASGVPTLLDTAQLPADVWPRSCAFAGADALVFATFGATYRVYDRVRRQWPSREVSPTNGVNAVLALGDDVLTVGDAGTVRRNGTVTAELGSLCNFLTAAGGVVFTGGQLGIVFDALTGRRLHQHRSPINCGVRFVDEHREYVVLGTYTGEGLVFAVSPDGRVEHLRDVRLHANAVKGLAVSGDVLMSVSADAGAAWFRLPDLTRVDQLTRAHDRIANGCAGLGDGWFASVSRDRLLRIWSPTRSAHVIRTPHDHSIKCVAASADGRYAATGSYDGRVAVYDRSGKRWSLDRRLSTAGISSLAYDEIGKSFLAGCYDGDVHQVAP